MIIALAIVTITILVGFVGLLVWLAIGAKRSMNRNDN